MQQGPRASGWMAAQREARRLVAARLFRATEVGQAEIARRLGVRRAAATQWHTRWQHGEARQLKACPPGIRRRN
jgi:hypothetical protein